MTDPRLLDCNSPNEIAENFRRVMNTIDNAGGGNGGNTPAPSAGPTRTILWTNPDPSVQLPATTINGVDTTPYDEFEIWYTTLGMYDAVKCMRAKRNITTNRVYLMGYSAGSGTNKSSREVALNDDSITITGGTAGSSSNNGVMVITEIVGIKY